MPTQISLFTVTPKDKTNSIYLSSSNRLCGIVEKRLNLLLSQEIILTEPIEKLCKFGPPAVEKAKPETFQHLNGMLWNGKQ